VSNKKQNREDTRLCYTCQRRSGGISNREPDRIFPLLVRPIYQNLRVRDSNGFTNCDKFYTNLPNLTLSSWAYTSLCEHVLNTCSYLRGNEMGPNTVPFTPVGPTRERTWTHLLSIDSRIPLLNRCSILHNCCWIGIQPTRKVWCLLITKQKHHKSYISFPNQNPS